MCKYVKGSLARQKFEKLFKFFPTHQVFTMLFGHYVLRTFTFFLMGKFNDYVAMGNGCNFATQLLFYISILQLFRWCTHDNEFYLNEYSLLWILKNSDSFQFCGLNPTISKLWSYGAVFSYQLVLFIFQNWNLKVIFDSILWWRVFLTQLEARKLISNCYHLFQVIP